MYKGTDFRRLWRGALGDRTSPPGMRSKNILCATDLKGRTSSWTDVSLPAQYWLTVSVSMPVAGFSLHSTLPSSAHTYRYSKRHFHRSYHSIHNHNRMPPIPWNFITVQIRQMGIVHLVAVPGRPLSPPIHARK